MLCRQVGHAWQEREERWCVVAQLTTRARHSLSYVSRGRSNCSVRNVAFCRSVVAMAMTVFSEQPQARRDKVCKERLARTALARDMPAPWMSGLWLQETSGWVI